MVTTGKAIAALGMVLLVAGCASTSSVEALKAESFGPVSVVVPQGWGSAELREGKLDLVDLEPPEGFESFIGSDFAPWTLLATLMERQTPAGRAITSMSLLNDDQVTCDGASEAEKETYLIGRLSELGLEGESDVVIEPFDHPFWAAAVRGFRQAPQPDVGAIVERDYWLCTPDGLVAIWFVTDPTDPEPAITLADSTVRTINKASTDAVVR